MGFIYLIFGIFLPGLIFISIRIHMSKYDPDSDLLKQFEKALSFKNKFFSNSFILISIINFIFACFLFFYFQYDHRSAYVFKIYDIYFILHYFHIYIMMLPSVIYFLFLYCEINGQIGKRLVNGVVLTIQSNSKACIHVDGDDLGFIRFFSKKEIFDKLKSIGIKEVYYKSHLLYDGNKNKTQNMTDMAKDKIKFIKKAMEDRGWLYIDLEGNDVNKMSNVTYWMLSIKNKFKKRRADKCIDDSERAKRGLNHVPESITKMEKKLRFRVFDDNTRF